MSCVDLGCGFSKFPLGEAWVRACTGGTPYEGECSPHRSKKMAITLIIRDYKMLQRNIQCMTELTLADFSLRQTAA
jgi:hypothetical protein